MGALTTVKKMADSEIIYIVNGEKTEKETIDALDKFIQKYVLCPMCNYPEIVILTKKSKIFGKCNSCGTISELDSKHRLATFILKNPPKNETEFKSKASENSDTKKVAETVKISNSKLTGDWKVRSGATENSIRYIAEQLQFYKDEPTITTEHISKVYQVLKKLKPPEELVPHILFAGCFTVNIKSQVERYSDLIAKIFKVLPPPF